MVRAALAVAAVALVTTASAAEIAAPAKLVTPGKLTYGFAATFAPFEFQPAWSPDGQSIAFTTWHDTQRGALWVTSARGGEPRRITREAGEYADPAWSPDGRELVVARGAGATARGQTMVRDPYFDLVRIPGGEVTMREECPGWIDLGGGDGRAGPRGGDG